MKDRACEIDVMKGIGILLVILGHCMPDFPINILAERTSAELQRFIYTFHMPMFFFCSGFVMNFAPPSIPKYLKTRTTRLVVPYLTFSFVSVGLRVVFSSFTRSNVDIVEALEGIFFYGKFFWFVYALFFVMLLILLLKKSNIALLAVSAIGVFFYYKNVTLFCLFNIGYFMLFGVAGFLLSKYRKVLMEVLGKYWIPSLLFVFLFLLFLNTPQKPFALFYFHKILMAFIGVFAAYGLATHPIKNETLSGIVNHFGKYSLQYYLIHEIVSLPCYYTAQLLHLHANIITVFFFFILITFSSYILLRILLLNKWCYKFVGIK